MLKELGERLRRLRNEKDLTLQQVAHVIGKDKQSISRVELGQTNPTYIYLTEICEGLGITMAELLRDDS